MIKRIAAIKNIGRFRSFTALRGGEFDWADFTILYGRNTKGKSTLTAILRSLQKSDPNLIIGRKSFRVTTDQEAYIKYEDMAGAQTTFRFQNQVWSAACSQIRIFDSRYVRENVHVDGQIQEGHQRTLEAVILGETGNVHQENVTKAIEACQVNINRKAAITREYNTYQQALTAIPFDEFRKLNPDDDVQSKIDAKSQEVSAYERYNDIKTKLEFIQTVAGRWVFAGYKDTLLPTLEVRQDAIRAHVRDHMASQEGATKFLYEGSRLLKSPADHCVFCGQGISEPEAVALVDEYSKLFSAEYRQLNENVKEALAHTSNFSAQKMLESDLDKLRSMGLDLNLAAEISAVDEANTALQQEIEAKSHDLNYQIEPGFIDAVCEAVAALEAAIKSYQEAYKDDFDAEKLAQLKAEAKQLGNIKARSAEPWAGLCAEYSGLEINSAELEKERETALKAKNDYARDNCGKYERLINENLEALQADFRLVDIKTRETVRSRDPLYAIQFSNGSRVSISSQCEYEAIFENTLSESDKRLLAFAFFMAEVESDPDVASLVVVLDDPMSSFDEDRKLLTIKKLKLLKTKVRQIVLLTHEQSFLKMLSQRVGPHAAFKITFDEAQDTSKIEILDVNEEYIDAFIFDIKNLHALLSASDDDVTWEKLRCMRDVIEHIQKKKYYLILQDEINAGKSVGAFTAKLKAEGIYTEATATAIGELYSHFWNHDDSDKVISRGDFTPGDLRSVVSDFFEVLIVV